MPMVFPHIRFVPSHGVDLKRHWGQFHTHDIPTYQMCVLSWGGFDLSLGTDSCTLHTHLADSCLLLGVFSIAVGDIVMPTTSLPRKCVPSPGGDFDYPWVQFHVPDVLA
jgi:hypothetical protein